ncbi:MAG TPA: hypothetical protein VFC19_45025 [Candidatus Limnocylindrales bacterium]|nr:hypothetical protein [Candidatus Limnocylindrales bacterium]
MTGIGQTQTQASQRDEVMRYHDLWTCPQWCVQDPEEDQYEQHWGQWNTMAPDGSGDVIQVRARLSWWTNDDGDPTTRHVEVQTIPGRRDDPVGVLLETENLDQLRDMIDEAEDQMDYYDEKWAYPGAEDDYNSAVNAIAAAEPGNTDTANDTAQPDDTSDDADGM